MTLPTPVMTSRDIAALFGVDRKTVLRWHALGKMPSPMRLKSKEMYWSAAVIQRWIDSEQKPRK